MWKRAVSLCLFPLGLVLVAHSLLTFDFLSPAGAEFIPSFLFVPKTIKLIFLLLPMLLFVADGLDSIFKTQGNFLRYPSTSQFLFSIEPLMALLGCGFFCFYFIFTQIAFPDTSSDGEEWVQLFKNQAFFWAYVAGFCSLIVFFYLRLRQFFLRTGLIQTRLGKTLLFALCSPFFALFFSIHVMVVIKLATINYIVPNWLGIL